LLSTAVESRLRKPSDGKLEHAKNDTEFPWWANASAGNLPNLTQTKTEKAPKEAKNDTKFPYWADAVGGAKPNFTQTKTEKAPKAAKNDTKFPYWADAVGGAKPNETQFTQTKTAKNDTKFPWWANATAGNVPNFTQTKTEKAPKESKKDEKFPYWNLPNFTQITKDLPKNLPKGQPTFADLGPFASKEAACDYCFTSHTRTSVVPNCICTAYDASDGPTMFCTASAAGVAWVAEKDGGCKCVQNDASNMGKTSCGPF